MPVADRLRPAHDVVRLHLDVDALEFWVPFVRFVDPGKVAIFGIAVASEIEGRSGWGMTEAGVVATAVADVEEVGIDFVEIAEMKRHHCRQCPQSRCDSLKFRWEDGVASRAPPEWSEALTERLKNRMKAWIAPHEDETAVLDSP